MYPSAKARRHDDTKQKERKLCRLAAHKAVDEVKRALGERGPVWWKDSSPDLNGTWRRTHPTPPGPQKSGVRALEDLELPKAAVSDLDGTLLDSVDLHALAWHEGMTKFGH